MSIYDYWGKLDSCTELPRRHLLVYHCLDVAAVATAFIQQNNYFVQDISKLLNTDAKPFFNLFIFFTALHDLGKFSSAFQALDTSQKRFSARIYDAEVARHDRLGAYLWDQFCFGVLESVVRDYDDEDLAIESLETLVTVVFGHHGYPIILDRPSALKPYFEPKNINDARDFIRELFALFQPKISKLPPIDRLNHVSWYLTAIVTLSDWVGSNQTYFPYCSEKLALNEYWLGALQNAKQALISCGLSDKAVPSEFLSIKDSFGFQPTPLQRWAQDVSLFDSPQLFILEDVTGAGKTEAALALTHRLMSAGLADGFYFGLPTMATSNAMYDRLMLHYQSMYKPDNNTVMPSIVLAQSTSRLHSTFQNVIAKSGNQGDYYKNDGTATALCNAWFSDSRKAALLSSVGVGTIDQALKAVLPQHHQSLRLFGLYRKVLIVDEVHAADEYMLTLLVSLMQIHLHHGGSVILLTATLANAQRQRLVNAWLQAAQMLPYELQHTESNDFPLVTHVSLNANSPVREMVLSSRADVCRRVRILQLHTKDECVDVILKSVRAECCVAWILNSVEDARIAYKAVSDVLKAAADLQDVELILFHSRFVLADRQKIEKNILGILGKKTPDGERIGRERRSGKILISTQVFQESLDADVDVMISDICPIDDLIQRAGRLHRHTRDSQGCCYNGPDQRSKPVLYLHAPKWEESPADDWLSREFRNTECVYRSPGRLWLGQKELIKQGEINMPGQARVLIESVYNEKNQLMIPKSLIEKEEALISDELLKRASAKSLLIDFEYGYCANSQQHWFNDQSDISTRFSDRETVRVVVCLRSATEGILPLVKSINHSVELSTLTLDKQKFADHLQLMSAQERQILELRYPEIRYLIAWCPEDDSRYGYSETQGFFKR